MSIKVMSLVWDHYPNGGGELLLALALADWANHDGSGIWASVDTMAGKTRQSSRAVQYQLRRMRRSGWLIIDAPGGGRHKTTTYRVPIERIPQGAAAMVQELHPLETVHPTTGKGAIDDQKGCKAFAPEPSLTVIEPSVEARNNSAPPPLPSSKIVIKIPLRNRTQFEVDQTWVDKLEQIYPAVDVPGTLREMLGWCEGNPARLKTRRGVRRFITTWLQGEQEKHGG